MSEYKVNHVGCHVVVDAFTHDECNELIKYFNQRPSIPAGGVRYDENGNAIDILKPHLRISDLTYGDNDDPLLRPYLDKLEKIICDVNDLNWKLDINRFDQPCRMVQYDAIKKGHFAPHVDHGPNGAMYRKLTAVLQLTDADDYIGGDLTVPGVTQLTEEQRRVGTVIIFPSYRVHGVTQVTQGTRLALVHNAIGPILR